MKVIDLINKINNNEEVPEKIKFDNTIFEYDKRQKEYNHKKDNGYYESLLYRVMTTHFIDVLLRAEVEVIEEKKEIEELDEMQIINARPEVNATKINEVIRAVNKINKDLEKGQTLNIEIDEETISNAIKKARNYLEREEK